MRPKTSLSSTARCHAFRWPVIAGLSAAVVCAAGVYSAAQPPRGGPAQPARPGGQPARANPAPARPGNTAPAARPGRQPAQTGGANATTGEVSVSPRNAPEQFTLDKPLITAEEIAAAERSLGLNTNTFRGPLRRADMSASTQNAVKEWARVRVYALTLKENRRRLHEVRGQLMADIRNAGTLQSDLQAKRRFREFMLREVQARTVELLDNNFYVRLQAVLILGNLAVVEPDLRGEVREEAWVPAAEPLHSVISSPDQHHAVKITAAKGLARVFLLARVFSEQQKTQIARDLIAQLSARPENASEDGWIWYQMRLVETLGTIDLELSADTRREPLILDALSRVAADKERNLCVRAEAAKALGRAPLAAGISEQVLAWVIADAAHDLAAKYNADAQAWLRQGAAAQVVENLARWPACFFSLYLAYQSTEEERRLYEGRRPGLLARRTGDKFIAESFGAILPAAAHGVKQPARQGNQSVYQPIPEQHVKALSEWLAKNVPADTRLHARLQPLPLKSPGAPAALNGPPDETQPTSTGASR